MFKKIILTVGFVFVTFLVFSQPGPPGGPGPFPTGPTGAPIDGGLSILLAAGAAYGAKKVYDFRKNEGEDEEIK